MNDYKLDNRKRLFEDYNFNLMKAAEEASLTLRKTKLNSFLIEKRLKEPNTFSSSQYEELTALEIDPYSLSIPIEQIITIESLQDSIHKLHTYLTSNNQDYIMAAIYSFRQYFLGSIEDNTMQLLSHYKIIDIFAYLLYTSQNLTLTYELLWIIINFLASDRDNNEIIRPLFSKECLTTYNLLLVHDLCNIAENTLWVLTGLSNRTTEYRTIIIQHPLYQTTLDLMNKPNIDASIYFQGLEFLSSCVSKVNYQNNKAQIKATFGLFIDNFGSKFAKRQSIQGICNISDLADDSYEIAEMIIKSGVILRILKFKNYEVEKHLLSPSLQILANALYASDNQIKELMNMRLLDFYDMILTKFPEKLYERLVSSGLINIAGSNNKAKIELMNSAIFDSVLSLINSSYEPTRENIVKMLKNIVRVKSINEEIISLLESKGIIQMIIDKSQTVSKKKQVSYLKIINDYLSAYQNIGKSSTFVIIFEQFKTLLINNPKFTQEEIDSILNYHLK